MRHTPKNSVSEYLPSTQTTTTTKNKTVCHTLEKMDLSDRKIIHHILSTLVCPSKT